MNMNILTQRARESVQTAQSLTIGAQNQQMEPAHLALSLIEQENGLIPEILRKMKKEELSSIFVVGEGRTLEGIVSVDRAVEAVDKQEKDLKNIVDEDIPVTSPDVTLLDLIPMAVTARVPIAVIDDNRKLLGIIVRVSVLSGLIAKGDDNNDVSNSD